jgi:hypothetical protein
MSVRVKEFAGTPVVVASLRSRFELFDVFFLEEDFEGSASEESESCWASGASFRAVSLWPSDSSARSTWRSPSVFRIGMSGVDSFKPRSIAEPTRVDVFSV